MARSDYSRFTPRRPRHAVTDAAALDVCVERSNQQAPAVFTAKLVDMSLEGFRLSVPVPLAVREAITIHVHSKAAGIDLTWPGTVRWQRPDGTSSWLVGCAAVRPADWETLGELFLNNILSTEPLARD